MLFNSLVITFSSIYLHFLLVHGTHTFFIFYFFKQRLEIIKEGKDPDEGRGSPKAAKVFFFASCMVGDLHLVVYKLKQCFLKSMKDFKEECS